MENISYITLFMKNYWMQAADIAFGDFSGAVNAFVNYETPQSSRGLIDDIEYLLSRGLLIDSRNVDNNIINFWKEISDRDLREKDAILAISIIKNRLGLEN